MADTIVITGASGFLGKNIYPYISKKYKIEAYTRKKNLKNYKYIENYKKIVSGKNKILIYLSQSNSGKNLNIKKELSLANIIAKKKWNYVIYISSYTVYLDSKFKIDEKGMLNLNSDYNNLKLKSEKIFLKTKNCVCLRISNILGRNLNPGTLLSDIIAQVKNKKYKNIILKNQNTIRDFLFIKDFCNLLLMCIKKKPKGIFNIGSGNGMSAKILASKVLSIMKKKKNIKTKENFFSKKVLDTSKIHNKLHWKPSVNINQELKKICK